MRDTIRKRSLLFLIQGGVMVRRRPGADLSGLRQPGILALLGWLLILSGVVQVISLFGATQVPYFWMQLVTIALEVLVGYLLISNPRPGSSPSPS